MKSAARYLLLLTSIALLQTSCSLPPAQAWKIVNSQGLLPYIAMETGRRPFPEGVTPILRQNKGSSSSAGIIAPQATRAPNPYLAYPGTSAPLNAEVPRTLAATTPGAVAGPAPKPRMVTTTPKQRLSAAPKPPVKEAVEARNPTKQAPMAKKPEPKTSVKPSKPEATEKPTASPVQAPGSISTPKPAATPAPKPITPTAPKTISPAPQQKVETPKPAPSTSTQAGSNGVPYGTSIPGRPGLVNSPYAGKHQIVDVSGLQAGQEVKCPYSGRLFLVPPGQVSSNKATAPGVPKP